MDVPFILDDWVTQYLSVMHVVSFHHVKIGNHFCQGNLVWLCLSKNFTKAVWPKVSIIVKWSCKIYVCFFAFWYLCKLRQKYVMLMLKGKTLNEVQCNC